MKIVFTLLAASSGLLPLAHVGHAQCTTSLVTTQSCSVPAGATTITDAGGGSNNVPIAGGIYVYSGSNGSNNLNMASFFSNPAPAA